MLRVLSRLVPFLLAGVPLVVPVGAAADAGLCQQAVALAERGAGVPDQLLDAISRVESGRYDASDGVVRAWPWTINAQGQGHFYASKAEAVAAAAAFRRSGVSSIDVGCTQINLMFHPDAFASLDDAFDPARNAAFAARFLTDLFHQQGSWPHAAAAYHSQTPELGTDYQRRVLEAWAQPIDAPAARGAGAHGGAGGGDFHHQVAALASLEMGGQTPVYGHPFGGAASLPLGGVGRIIHEASAGRLTGMTGRTLAAYRAMPVASFRPPPIATQFHGMPAMAGARSSLFASPILRD